MPRIITTRRTKLTPKIQRQQLGYEHYQVSRSGVWVDPFPDIPGTKPEKMVYAELVRRGIPFQFQEWFHVDLPLESTQWLRPDFVCPTAKCVIMVQGDYFHTQPNQIVKDSLEFAIYQMEGWTVLPWWEYQIESELHDLFDQTPQLLAVQNTGAPMPHVAKWYDDLKGLRKANQERRKPWTHKPVTLKVKHRTHLAKTGKTTVKRNAQKGLFQ